jgi:diguanylate cyclase (GGDEF)-like protein
MLGVDILSRFDGNAAGIYHVMNTFGNFVIFLMSPVLPSLWVAYVYLQVFRDERKTRKRLLYPLCIINAINAVVPIFSQFFGWLYYIDSDNIYHRGPFFLFPALITIMLIVAAYAITLLNRRRLEKKSFLSLIFFAVPPSISIILQIRFYGISLMLNSVVLSLLVVFLNIQNDNMYTDYLTEVSNRKKLDAYLKKKVNSSTEEKGFSAILIDINNFKYINDTYGHCIGDQALEATAKLLKSCLRTNDFIARFGGDEFCIVLDISDKSVLEAMVCRIKSCLKTYNESGSHPYVLGFSMGYAVYDHHLHMSEEEFLKQVDLLMYQEKQAYKDEFSMQS